MKKELLTAYRQFRAIGESAATALANARTLVAFRQLESEGLVRISAQHEQESYFDVYGAEEDPKHQKEMERILERDGCWYVETGYLDAGGWQHADGIGMCTGYSDPCSPFENCYVPELMAAAVQKAEAVQEAETATAAELAAAFSFAQ